MKVRPSLTDFNDLPLWRASRERELRALPRSARRLAIRYGIDATTARLMAALAGLGQLQRMTMIVSGQPTGSTSDRRRRR